jgi:tape measure domain-containing protein
MTQDTLTFFLKMKDLASGGLTKFAASAKRTFSHVEKYTDSMKGKNKILGSSYDMLKLKIRSVESVISKSKSVSQIRQARKELVLLQKQAKTHIGNVSGGGGGLLSSIKGAVPMLGLAGALTLGAGSFNDALAADSRAKAINFGTGGQGVEAISQVKKINDLYGINNAAGLEGFQKLSGSIKAPLEDQLELYKAVSAASRTMGLSADQTNGSILALSQMASKGKVSAEELRGQLGERIPGAFRMAAEAMGVTESALNKMMEQGELASSVFLPRFAKHLQQTFGKEALKVADSPAAKFERFKNVIYELSVTIGGMLMPPLTTLMQWFINGVSFVKQYSEWFIALGAGIVAYAGYVSIASVGTSLWAAAQWGLNIAMTANPIGLVVAGIAALVVGIVMAWRKFEGFRKVVMGLWEAFKQVFTNISGMFKRVFSPIMEAITAFKEGRYLDASKAVAKQAFNLTPAGMYLALKDGDGITKGVKEAYKKGSLLEAIRSRKPDKIGQNTPASFSGATGASNTEVAQEAVKGVVRGGARVININGVKLIENLQIHTQNMDESIEELEEKLQVLLLRVLNSAAVVQ